MAEAHPVGFQWVIEAKNRGAKVIHVDPRFTRTSALAHRVVAVRAGSDMGRIYRVVPKGGQKLRPVRDLTKLSAAELALIEFA